MEIMEELIGDSGSTNKLPSEIKTEQDDVWFDDTEL